MFSDSKPLSNISPAVPAANLPVFGSGTVGRLTKWGGFTSTNSAIGDSGIYEDKFGKVGIGTDSPDLEAHGCGCGRGKRRAQVS